MTTLATKSELDKLSSSLGVKREELDFLADIPADQLRALRAALYELLISDDRVLFARLAAISGRLPIGLTTMLAQRALGPLLTARVAAEWPSGRAALAVARLPTAFVADVCVHLDPRRTSDLIRRMPVRLIVDVARELSERGDFMTMSRFVEFVSDDAARAVVEAIEDERALLHVAFYMGSKNRVDHLFRMLASERLGSLIVSVRDDPPGLLPEFLSLLVHVSYGLKRELGDLAAEQGEAVLDGYIRATQELGLWADVLPVVSAMSEASRRTVVNLAILGEPQVQESILVAADEQSLWGIVLPLVEMMDDANQDAVAAILSAKGRDTLARAADAALTGEHWGPLIDLVRRMPRSKQDEFVGIARAFGDVDPELLERIERRAAAGGLGELFAGAGAG